MSQTETRAETRAEAHSAAEPMTHKEILEALSGLLLGMFVAILSSTVVSNALPIIVPELGGSESGYTWVVTAALLATTISTPIWGKLSDLFAPKTLVQTALVIFVVSSMVAGLSQNMAMLITTRVFQGLGAGGLTALSQVIIATMVSPRERGRYSGYLGATFALGTVGGPLIGGALTEHLNWRWCFYVGVPFAILAFIVLQMTLHLPSKKRKAQIDYLGAALLAGGVSALLIWVSLAGQQFDWWSWQTWLMVGGGIVLLGLTVLAEQQAPEPIIPLRLFKNSTIVLSSAASIFVGVAMFGATVFLSQFFQLARGESPMMAGVMTIPLIFGLFLSSTVSGQVITRTGKWKMWLVAGGVLLTAGLFLMATADWDTEYWILAIYMFLVGTGVGMMMQNLVLAVQNVVGPHDLGAASSFVAFARSLGGAIGVSALGAVLSHRVATHIADGLADHGIKAGALGSAGGAIPDISAMPEPIRTIVRAAYGNGIADVFLVAAPFAAVAFLITLAIRETALRSNAGGAQEAVAGDADAVNEQVWNTPEDHESAHLRRHHHETAAAGAGAAGGATAATAVLPAVGHEQHDGQVSAADRAAASAPASGPAPAQEPVAPAAAGGAPRVEGRYVSGTVTQGHGRALTGAQVTLADRSGHQIARTVSGDAGAYLLAAGEPGTFLLIAAAPGLSPSADLVAVGDHPVHHDITLAGRSAVTGRVLRADARTHVDSPVADSLITLTDESGQVVGSTRSSADGAYSFGGLTAGEYVLTVTAGTHRPRARSVEVAESDAVAYDLMLDGGGHLTGEVVTADGATVRQATVTVVDADGQVVGTAVTGDDGRYGFENLDAGRYTVTAAGYAPVAVDVTVEDDRVSSRRILLGGGDYTGVEGDVDSPARY